MKTSALSSSDKRTASLPNLFLSLDFLSSDNTHTIQSRTDQRPSQATQVGVQAITLNAWIT
jgi:hypothetical protein